MEKKQKLQDQPPVDQLQETPLAYQNRKCQELSLDARQYQILIRLPVKTLFRFRCALKTWRALIDDPGFQKQYAHHHARQYPLLLVAKNEPNGANALFSTYSNKGAFLNEGAFLRKFSKKFPKSGGETRGMGNDKMTFHLIQHCQGLICFRLLFDGSLHVCNLSTEQMISLPKQDKKTTRPLPPDEKDDVCVGFGYAASTNKFKVVRFYKHDFDDVVCYCKVLILGGSLVWKEVTGPPYFPDGCATLLNGALHLLPNCATEQNDRQANNYIAAFDVDTESYRKRIRLPELCERNFDYNDSMLPFQLVVLRGSLCLAFELLEESKHKLELWFLKDFVGHKWVKEHKIYLSSVVSNVRSHKWTIPIAVTGDEILLSVGSVEKDELCIYNIEETGLEKKIGFINCSAVLYEETFSPLEVGDHHMGSVD